MQHYFISERVSLIYEVFSAGADGTAPGGYPRPAVPVAGPRTRGGEKIEGFYVIPVDAGTEHEIGGESHAHAPPARTHFHQLAHGLGGDDHDPVSLDPVLHQVQLQANIS